MDHLLAGLIAAAASSFVLALSQQFRLDTLVLLVFFNFLFASFVFPLSGTLHWKLGLLIVGDVMGLFWNSLFSQFIGSVGEYWGGVTTFLYVILNPVLNLVWFVALYSVSLTILARPKRMRAGQTVDR